MKSLSKRLDKIASYVDEGSFIADIGSDHCLLPIFLLSKGIVSRAQAIENKEGPYKRMVKAIDDSGFKENIAPSLSNGIERLNPSVDTIVLAGMGGILISNILKDHPEKLDNIKTIIVDAHTDIKEVYEALSMLSFEIKESCFLMDKGKPYDVMKWVKTDKIISYDDMEKKYGAFNIKDPNEEWKLFYAHRLDVLKNIKKHAANDSGRLSSVEEEIKEIEKILYKK